MDSLSSHHSHQNTSSSNPLTQRIHLTHSIIASVNTQVSFIWISDHVNLSEHEAVDKAAKEAIEFAKITYHISPLASDYKNHFRSQILSSWNLLWENQLNNKLLTIKINLAPWWSFIRDIWREELILARLKTGHIHLTHTHLLNSYILTPPLSLTVKKKTW